MRVAAAVAGSTLIVSAWPAVTHWAGETPRPAGLGQADALGLAGAVPHPGMHTSRRPGNGPRTSRRPGVAPKPSRSVIPTQHTAQHKPKHSRQHAPAAPVYRNPVRSISGLIPERIDMGVDYGGSGPIYALGDAVITGATGNSAGWPGGGWITYRLTDGPDSGLMVYVAEDVRPTVQEGQHVSSSTVIANMFAGGDGIETGWAQPDGSSAESQLPEAGGISGYGPFPTKIGLNFEELLQSLGVAAANNRGQAAYGILPANYPASWK